MGKKYYYSGKKKTVTVILQVLMFFLALATITCFLLSHYLGNTDAYYDRIIGEKGEFDTVVLNAVETAFQRPNSIVNIPPQELYDSLDKDKILEGAHNYVDSALKNLFYKTPIETANYDFPELQEDIQTYFDNHTILQATESEIAKVKSYYVSLANSQSNFISDRLIEKVSGMVSVGKICNIAEAVHIVGIVLMLAATTTIIVINRDNISRGLYKSVAPCWVASVTLAIPSLILAYNRISEKLHLAESPFQRFVTEIVAKVEDDLISWNRLHLIVLTIMTVFCLLYYAMEQNRKHKKIG